MAIPARIMDSDLILITDAIIIIMATVIRLPAKADIAVRYIAPTIISVPVAFIDATPRNMIANVAPNIAPCDTPVVNGDASGFSRTDCMTSPAAPRQAPVATAAKTLGIRIL